MQEALFDVYVIWGILAANGAHSLRNKHIHSHHRTAIVAVIPWYKQLLNPWHDDCKEPRLTELVAVMWQYRGLRDWRSAIPSTLISIVLTGFRYFSYQAATQLSSWGLVDTVPDPRKELKFLTLLGIEPGTPWMAVRHANHYINEVVDTISFMECNTFCKMTIRRIYR